MFSLENVGFRMLKLKLMYTYTGMGAAIGGNAEMLLLFQEHLLDFEEIRLRSGPSRGWLALFKTRRAWIYLQFTR